MVKSAESPYSAGPRSEVSSPDSRMYFIYRKLGTAVRVIATHIDDTLGRGEPDLELKARGFSEKRFGESEGQEGPFIRVGVELAKEKDFSATLTREDFTRNQKLLPTSPYQCARRKEPLSMEYIKLRQWELGVLCWVNNNNNNREKATLETP